MFKLVRKGFGEYAHGTLKEMFRKARHDARECRRSYNGKANIREVFYVRDENENTIIKIVLKPYFYVKADKCKRLAVTKTAIYKYHYVKGI